jgi:hypothetical protein
LQVRFIDHTGANYTPVDVIKDSGN